MMQINLSNIQMSSRFIQQSVLTISNDLNDRIKFIVAPR